jgi:preprotein translocase subunit YajC
MIAGLKAGDCVTTNGGLMGEVVEVSEGGVARVQFGEGIIMSVKTSLIYDKTPE